MAGHPPPLYADDAGVWREDKPGRPFGIRWEEIASVGGYKLDGITEVYTIIELDFEYGEWFELRTDSTGFPEVARAVTARLPGIPSDWLTRIEGLGPRDAPVTVWRRAEASESGWSSPT